MLNLRFAIRIYLISGVTLLGSGVASGQDYPTKPIRIIAGSAGGGGDNAARIIAQGISSPLGQSLVVENRAGGSINSAEPAAKASPDGYTLLVIGGALWIAPLLQKMPYDAVRDFSPITLVTRGVSILAVHPSVPVRSVKELIVLAKARPGELNFASGLIGGSQQLATGMFKSMAGINIVEVPYKGSTAVTVTATISGETQALFNDLALMAPHMKSGKVRALAVTSATPSALLPELPTVAASGVPGYEYIGMTGMLAPAKTPGAIVNRLNREVVRVLNQPEVKARFAIGGEETVANSPEQFAATIKSEIAKMDKVIKDAGVKGN